jgi:hypothetical protein
MNLTRERVDREASFGATTYELNVSSNVIAVKYSVQAGGQVYSAFEVATRAWDAWVRFLASEGLLPLV